MIANKHITIIVAALMAALVCLCLCATGFSAQLVSAVGGLGVEMEYESKLFDTAQVLEVNIIMDDEDWEAMLDNAMTEEYVQCDVEVAGQTFYHVGIRPKGNTSLSTIVNDPDTDRYSFKLEFDQFVDGQTCYGLDKLILNNNYADATNMKEALIYDMFAYVGADASLYNYAKVSVNGEYWGIYLALEAVEDSFMLRNYGTDDGELYKPDSMNMGGDGDRGGMPDMGDFDMGDMDFEGMDFSDMQSPVSGDNAAAEVEQTPDANASTDEPDTQTSGTGMQPGNFQRPGGDGEMPDMGDFNPSEMFGGGGFGGFGGMGSNGGSNLNYSDDELDSYSTIWDGEVTNTGDKDHKRVVTALKNISEGTSLEKYMDTDNLLRYAAVHIFSVNSDSLSGSMAHNYYLYESDGQLNILPWDYNLAFGGMGGGMSGGATDTVNSAIDDAWSSTNFFDALLEDEEYHADYYVYMAQVVDYIQNGSFEAFYSRTRRMIDTLVETDPNAFYAYDEYLTAVETLYEVVTLRGQSIAGQIDGSIPATESEQLNSDVLVDASHLDLNVMGSMNMGGGGGNLGGFDFGGMDFEQFDNDVQNEEPSTDADTTSASISNSAISFLTESSVSDVPQFGGGQGGFAFTGEMPEGFDPSEMFDGEIPEDFDPSQTDDQMPEGVGPTQSGGEMPEGFDPSQSDGQIPESTEQTGETDSSATQEQTSTAEDNVVTSENEQVSQNGQPPNMGNIPDTENLFGSNSGQAEGFNTTIIYYGVAAVVMLAAFLFALLYRRKPRKR